MKQLHLNKQAIVFFAALLCSQTSFAQSSTTDVKHEIKVITGLQLSDQINGGLYYKGNAFDNKSNAYNKALSIPMLSLSVGWTGKNLYHLFDFAYRSRSGFYDLGVGKDHINMKYFSYQVWYDFLNKKDFPIKPLVSLNLAYANKTYSFESITDKSNGTSIEFKDASKTYIIQLPVGIYSHYQHFFVSFSCTIPVFSWINGSFKEHLNTYSHSQLRSSDFTEDDYSGNASSSDYGKQRSVFNLRIAYMFKLEKK